MNFLVITLNLILSACIPILEEEKPRFGLQTVYIEAASDSNSNTAFFIDLIVSYQPETTQLLQSLTAYSYFEGIEQIKNDHKVKIWRWEVTPGKNYGQYMLNIPKSDTRISDAFLYAKYCNNGINRIKVSNYKHLKIRCHYKHVTADEYNYNNSSEVADLLPVAQNVRLDKFCQIDKSK